MHWAFGPWKSRKSGGKSQFSLSFLSPTVNDLRRKLYTVGIHSIVEKRAKRILQSRLLVCVCMCVCLCVWLRVSEREIVHLQNVEVLDVMRLLLSFQH